MDDKAGDAYLELFNRYRAASKKYDAALSLLREAAEERIMQWKRKNAALKAKIGRLEKELKASNEANVKILEFFRKKT